MEEKIIWQEEFVLTKIRCLLSKNNTLLNMPNSVCFTYCLKEIIDICEISENINNRSYFKLFNSFYNFLKKDKILKEIDCYVYYDLLRKIKEIIENNSKVDIKSVKKYFTTVLITYKKQYINLLKEKMLNIDKISEQNKETLNDLTDIYINELLSSGYSYKYLNKIFNIYIYQTEENIIFEDFNKLIVFLNDSCIDNFDIFLPLKNYKDRDINFIMDQYSDQRLELGKDIKTKFAGAINLKDNAYYCHIYFSRNDYIKGIEEHLKRVKSIFNILKFYTNSQVDIDYNDCIYIKSKILGEIAEKNIESIFRYSFFQGTQSIIDTIKCNFKTLKAKNQKIIEEIYDIMNYSQKDSDFISNDQFVSKWISLEMTASKNNNKYGFDAVIEYVPNYLAITFYRQMLNVDLKKIFYKKNISIEDFIRKKDIIELKEEISKIRNPYYSFLINKYIEEFSSIKKVNAKVMNCKSQIEDYLYRIYILRNKYVHVGDTTNHNDILRYVLNIIEPFFVDRIIKSFNNYIYRYKDVESFEWEYLFDELNYKYQVIYGTLSLSNERSLKIDNNYIDINNLCKSNELENLLINILLDHHLKLNEMLGRKRKKIYEMEEY